MRTKATLYERLASRIEAQIEGGSLRSGDKIPSIRELRSKSRLSVSTILKAYESLEDRGLVYAEPKSGYYVSERVIEAPAPRLVERPASPCRLETGDLIQAFMDSFANPANTILSSTVMGPDMFPHKTLGRLVSAAGRNEALMSRNHCLTDGEPELRRQLARRSLYQGSAYTADEIVVTMGCMEALNIALRSVAKAGDTIAVDSPGFFGVMQAIESLGMYALEIPNEPSDGLCLERFEDAINKRKVKACLFVVNYCNPTGAVLSDEKKAALVALAAKKNIPIIEDDIYGDLHHGLSRPRTLKSFDTDGNVILCSSFSKSLAPAFRIGWAVPGRFLKVFRKHRFSTSIGTPPLLQEVTTGFLKAGGYDRHLRRVREKLKLNKHRLAEALDRHFPKGSRWTRPTGGTSIWVELPRGTDTTKAFQTAIRENISISPGAMFSPKGCYRNFLRVTFGTMWTRRLERSLKRVGEILQ